MRPAGAGVVCVVVAVLWWWPAIPCIRQERLSLLTGHPADVMKEHEAIPKHPSKARSVKVDRHSIQPPAQSCPGVARSSRSSRFPSFPRSRCTTPKAADHGSCGAPSLSTLLQLLHTATVEVEHARHAGLRCPTDDPGPLVLARVCRLLTRKWVFVVSQSAILSGVARGTGRG